MARAERRLAADRGSLRTARPAPGRPAAPGVARCVRWSTSTCCSPIFALAKPCSPSATLSATPPAITSCGNDRIAGLDRKRIAQLRRFGAGGVEARKLDRGEAILLARHRLEHHAQRVAGGFGARLDVGVIIALAAQQFLEQVGVGARASRDLRRVRRALAVGLERRLGAERLQLSPRRRRQRSIPRSRPCTCARRSRRPVRLNGLRRGRRLPAA